MMVMPRNARPEIDMISMRGNKRIVRNGREGFPAVVASGGVDILLSLRWTDSRRANKA